MTLEINKIYCADCLELMKEIDDKSIDMILCDLIPKFRKDLEAIKESIKPMDETTLKILREKIDRESEWTWRYEVFRDNMESIKKQVEVDIDALISQIKIQEWWDTCPRWMSINEAKLRHIIERHLSPKKEIDSQEIMKSTIPDLTDEEYKKNYTNPLSQ